MICGVGENMMKFLMLLLWISCSGCQYGTKQDYGRFKSAALIQDGRTVIFTFHDLVYRPAKGIAAFPDGGIPKYIMDTSFLCTFDRTTGKLRKIMKEKNKEWTNGSGALHIVTSRGNAVVVSQSGQKRQDLGSTLTRHHILNIATGAYDTFDLADDLRKHRRKMGPLYLCDDNGTLVIITPSESAKSSGTEVPEIWVRLMGGRYILAGASAHYQETVNGEVVYWDHKDRQYYAFSIQKNITRRLKGYSIPASKQVTEGVSVGSSGASVDFGVRTNSVWHYKPLPITATAVRSL